MHNSAYILLLLTTLFWGGNAIAGNDAAFGAAAGALTTGNSADLAALVGQFYGEDTEAVVAEWPAVSAGGGVATALRPSATRFFRQFVCPVGTP
jgi:hypothetical protein